MVIGFNKVYLFPIFFLLFSVHFTCKLLKIKYLFSEYLSLKLNFTVQKYNQFKYNLNISLQLFEISSLYNF